MIKPKPKRRFRGHQYNHKHRFSYQNNGERYERTPEIMVEVLTCRCGYRPVWTRKELKEIDKKAKEMQAMFSQFDEEGNERRAQS